MSRSSLSNSVTNPEVEPGAIQLLPQDWFARESGPLMPLSFGQAHRSLVGRFDGDMHAKRVQSLVNSRPLAKAGASLGVVRAGSLAVSTIGLDLALARGLTAKHAYQG